MKTDINKSQTERKGVTFQSLLTQLAISSFASLLGLSLGHPLDTIRVRMQVSDSSGFVSTVMHTYRGEGFKGFFKGFVSPLLGAVPYNTW